MKNNTNNITENIVREAAQLSRLSFNEEEIGQYKGQLSRILEYIAQLDEVNTDKVEPTSHVLSSMQNVYREDELKASLSSDEAVKNSSGKKDGFFRVPKVI
jgi:aspartyl-tRNA(Asn)/glutamyl-tRNA(Gln) amidotransferase subunit C